MAPLTTPLYDLFVADAVDWLRAQPGDSIDLLVTDPAYESLEKHRGKRRLNNLGVADVIAVPRIHRGYPAEKPAAVADVLIRQSSRPGELIADPFMGSGSIGIAALRAGRRFSGCDINPEAVRLTADRLRQFGAGQVPGDLPDVTRNLLEFSDTAP